MSRGKKMRAARLSLGLSQEAVAEQLGVSQPTVQGWESDSFAPKRDRCPDVARVYRMPLEDLLPKRAA